MVVIPLLLEELVMEAVIVQEVLVAHPAKTHAD